MAHCGRIPDDGHLFRQHIRPDQRAGGAPPLVLLPGASAASLMWLPNIRAFSDDFRTFAVDNIYDYGRSVYTRALRGPEDFVNWMDELFSSLGLEADINLVGFSLGGWLTAQYALRHPDRLAKIVLLAPAATVLPLRLRFWMRVALMSLPGRAFTRSLMYWALEDLVRKNEASRTMVEGVVDDMVLASRCFKPKRKVRPTVLTDGELQSIHVPVLFLVGRNEKIYSARRAVNRLGKVAPWMKTEIIPNAGHDLAIVQAELVNKMVLDFLKR